MVNRERTFLKLAIGLFLAAVLGCSADSDMLGPGEGDSGLVPDQGVISDSGTSPDLGAADLGLTDTGVADVFDAGRPDTQAGDTGAVDTGACVPDCWLKSCGDDGCGGSCGDCLPGASCDFSNGICDCPASTCGTAECGVSSCGARCGDCGNEVCGNGFCLPGNDCTSSMCRELSGQRLCDGQRGRGACLSDPGRTAACTCTATQALECEDCYTDAPIHCSNSGCTPGLQCNEWTGICEAVGLPVPPPGQDNGEACMSDSDCRSSGGLGTGTIPQCYAPWNGGYCMSYCNTPLGGFFATGDLEAANCPSGSLCVPGAPQGFFGVDDPPGMGACLKECTADSDCRVNEGYFCRRNFGQMSTTSGVCSPDHCLSRGCYNYVCGC